MKTVTHVYANFVTHVLAPCREGVRFKERWLGIASAIHAGVNPSPFHFCVQALNALLNISMLLGTAASGFSLPSISSDT